MKTRKKATRAKKRVVAKRRIWIIIGILVLLLFIVLLVIPTILKITKEIKNEGLAREVLPKEFEFPEGFAGPNGCTSLSECVTFCKDNLQECELWCEKNKGLCVKYKEEYNKEKIEERKEIIISSVDECELWWYECKDFCAKIENYDICRFWCEQNPKVCGVLSKGSFAEENLEMPPPISRPNLTLTYYKGLIITSNHLSSNYDFSALAMKAKELNANIISIFHETAPHYRTSDYDLKIKDALLINAAHENGLLVQYMLPCYFDEDITKDKALTKYLECVAEYAKFAADMEIYHLTLHHELDVLVQSDDDWERYTLMEKVSKEALKEIKKYYTGKVGIGFCCSNAEYFGYDFRGYDYYTGMFYAKREDGNVKNFTKRADQEISSWFKIVKTIVDEYGMKILLLGETACCNPEKKDPSGKSECDYNPTLPCSPEEEAIYYQTLFEETHNLVDGYFINYEFATANIKDEPAEQVVKEWYGKL